MKQILIIGMILFSLSLVSAISLYTGESINMTLQEEYVYYEITENSTEVNLNITKNGTLVIIQIDKYMESDSFILTFFNEKDEVIPKSISSGGGGGGGCKYNINYDWNCSEWSECIDEIQTRICKARNNCGNYYGKPNETKTCIIPIIQNDTDIGDTDVDEPEPIENKWLWIEITFFILLIVCAYFLLGYYFKKRKNTRLNKQKYIKKINKEDEK